MTKQKKAIVVSYLLDEELVGYKVNMVLNSGHKENSSASVAQCVVHQHEPD